MSAAGWVLSHPSRLAAVQRASSAAGRLAGRRGRIGRLPGPLSAWTEARDAPAPPTETFRAWWRRNR